MQAIAFGWCGMMGGIGGLIQAQVVKQMVPNALIGRELDVLAAVVLGGARLGGGRGSVLGCFLGGVDPFSGFGRVLPVVIALIVLQVLTSGLNLLGANQHLSTAVWGLFLIGVMILRWVAGRFGEFKRKKG